ncbi:MAG TPA: RidA family protein [Solirubrobacterales bacterium]|jgi:enamine deaminase RidA (YjgF/YER057c/UK114 family)
MSKTVVDVPGVADSTQYGFVQCVTAGDLVFPAGQTGINEDFVPVSDEFEPQARQAFENVERVLAAAGSTLADIVMMTVYLTDMSDAEELWRVRREFLGEDLCPSALIGVKELWAPNVRVELHVIAVRSSPAPAA